jgi:myo-inositol-1(or 4)-monophosphatase
VFDTEELLDLAMTVAMAAGGLLRAGVGRDLTDVESKSSSTDMVTEVDRASEALIVERILSRRPTDAILAEEGGGREGTSGVRWLIDPLDGTTNYLYGFPVFAVSLAAEVDRETLVGVVYDPSRDETFSARRGHGAWCNGRRLSVPRGSDLSSALVGTGFSYDPERRRRQAGLLPSLLPAVRDIRRAGAAALDLCWVAAGRLDAYYEAGLAPWDRAAGGLVASEAGAWVDSIGDRDTAEEMTVACAPELATGLFDLLRRAVAGPAGDSTP